MPDKWDQYAAPAASSGTSDPWAQYAAQTAPAAYNPETDPYRQRYDISPGSILSGVGGEIANAVKGAAGLFGKPETVTDYLAGPALPVKRMVQGYVQSAGEGLRQAVGYGNTGQPVRAIATTVGALNPMSSGQTASINRNVDQGQPIGNVVGQGLTDVGMILAPKAIAPVATAARSTIGRAALLGRTPEGAYESALKPSTTISQADRAAMIKTGIEEGVPVSKGGLEKLGDLIDNLNDEIKDTIAQDPNRPIDPNAVAQRIKPTAQRFAVQVNPKADLAAIEASKQEFLESQGAQPGQPAIPGQPVSPYSPAGRAAILAGQPLPTTGGTPAVPPSPAQPMGAAAAQEMKQGTYRILKGKYGEQGSAATEAQKALARGLKEEIATQFPEINNLNAAESRLLDLQPVLERAVNRISNHQLVGIGTPAAAAATTAVTGSMNLGKVAAVAKAVLDNPVVKSRLAIAVSKANKIPIAQATSRVQAYAATLESAASAQQAYSNDGTPSQPATPQP